MNDTPNFLYKQFKYDILSLRKKIWRSSRFGTRNAWRDPPPQVFAQTAELGATERSLRAARLHKKVLTVKTTKKLDRGCGLGASCLTGPAVSCACTM